MDAYGTFARVYDMFMDNVDYDAWSRYLITELRKDGIEDGIVLDLGCGTGTMTELLAKAGYDMIGVDNSFEMLDEAMEKRAESGYDILYLMQEMQSFELYGTVRAIVSVCDCMNYILSEEELLQVFRLCNNYLDPSGLLIFDMNTEYKYRELLGDKVIAENREDGAFIWDNSYDPASGINVYDLALFLPVEDGLFERSMETHVQKAYSLNTVKRLLIEAGMEIVAVYDAYTEEELRHDSERMTVIARERGKQASGEV